MALHKTYTNIWLSNGGATPTGGPQTLATSASYTTNGIPCRGARYVVVRMKSTNSQVPTAMALNVGNQADRTLNFTGAVGAGGYDSALRGSLAVRCDQGGGNTMMLCMGANSGRFFHDFVQVTFTSAAVAMTGVTVEVEVHYANDADSTQMVYGQAALTVPTT